MSTQKKTALLPAILSKKCPSCRKGFVFTHKHIFPLTKLVELKRECPVCGQVLVSEKNNGAGINYALTMIMFMLNLLWFCPLYIWLKGSSNVPWYNDNSIWWYLGSSSFVVIMLQPWLMRISRMLYLYFYIGYGKTPLPE